MPEVLTEEPEYRLMTEVLLRCPNCGQSDCQEAEELKAKIIKEVAERSRLEREVIEAAKAEHNVIAAYEGNSTMDAWNAIAAFQSTRSAAVRALIEFEANQQQIKK